MQKVTLIFAKESIRLSELSAIIFERSKQRACTKFSSTISSIFLALGEPVQKKKARKYFLVATTATISFRNLLSSLFKKKV